MCRCCLGKCEESPHCFSLGLLFHLVFSKLPEKPRYRVGLGAQLTLVLRKCPPRPVKPVWQQWPVSWAEKLSNSGWWPVAALRACGECWGTPPTFQDLFPLTAEGDWVAGESQHACSLGCWLLGSVCCVCEKEHTQFCSHNMESPHITFQQPVCTL